VIEIAVASGKGGVGKSTIATSLAIILAKSGWKVILADADAEAPNAHLILGIDSWDEVRDYSEGYVAEIDYTKCNTCGACAKSCAFKAVKLVNGRYVINKFTCEGCLTCSLVCPKQAIQRIKASAGKLRIVRETRWGFPLVSALLSLGRPNSGKLVTEIKEIARSLARSDTIIILDSAAGIGCQVIASLAGASAAILVAEPTPASFSDLRRIHSVAKHFGIPSALVINKYDLNPEYVKVIVEYAVTENIDILGTVPYDDHVPKSLSYMKPLIEVFPEASASKAITDLAKRFEEKILRNWAEWRRKFTPTKAAPYVPIIIKPNER